MARKRLVTVEEAILLHLSEYSNLSPEDTVPIELAQAGMAISLGVRRSHISMSLDSAKGRDAVEEHLAHVKGKARRRKCYFLTYVGIRRARKLRQRIGNEEVEARLPDGSVFHGTLAELEQRAERLSLPRLALLASGGKIVLPAEKGEPASHKAPPKAEFFVGRGSELEQIANFLSERGSILSITGMPGIGKTALAARAFADNEPFWYNIKEWTSPRNLSNHLAAYLEQKGSSRLGRYLEAHEVPDIADMRDILQSSGQLFMVLDDCQNASVTMRGFLRMIAWASVETPSLGACFLAREMPDIADSSRMLDDSLFLRLSLGPLEEDASNELLQHRGLDPESAHRILEIAGGHPLILTLAEPDEAAAGRGLEKMLSRIIYQGLDSRSNRLLHQLSVFREPVPSNALVEGQEDMEALDALERKCLISDAGGWSMHNLVRDFYYSRQSPEERTGAHERAAEYYNAISRISSQGLEETYHLLRAGDYETGLLNLTSKAREWFREGYADELLYLCDMVPRDWGIEDEQLQLEFVIASAFDLLGQWKEASDHYGICFEISREIGDTEWEARTLRRQGAILYRKGMLKDAERTFRKALDLAEAGTELSARIQGSLGVVYWARGETGKSRPAHEMDLEISAAQGDREGTARAQNNLGILDWESGDYGSALERYSSALETAQLLGDKKLVAILYSNIGDVLASQDKGAEAKRYYERCLELAEDLKFNWQVAEAYRGLAEVDPRNREQHLRRSLAIFKRLGAEKDAKAVKQMLHGG